MPDEKVTITLVSYLNMRLMELSIEIRAARKILHAWRRYKLRKQHEKLKVIFFFFLLYVTFPTNSMINETYIFFKLMLFKQL